MIFLLFLFSISTFADEPPTSSNPIRPNGEVSVDPLDHNTVLEQLRRRYRIVGETELLADILGVKERQAIRGMYSSLRDVTSIEELLEGAKVIQKKNNETLKKRYLNLIFLRMQEVRVAEEILALNGPFPEGSEKPWLKEQRDTILKLKNESLDLIRMAQRKILIEDKVPLFHNIHDVFEFVGAKDRDASKSHSKNDAGSMPQTYSKSMNKIFSKSMSKTFSKSGGGNSLDGYDLDDLDPGLFPSLALSRRTAKNRSQDWLLELEGKNPSPPAKVDSDLNVAAFLATIGAKPTGKATQSRDLSQQFNRPGCQGDTYACVAFAVMSDLETINGIPPLSKSIAHAVAAFGPNVKNEVKRARERGVDEETLSDQIAHTPIMNLEGVFEDLKAHPIAQEQHFPFDRKKLFPDDMDKIRGKKYGVGTYAAATDVKVTPSELRSAIDAGKPIIATINTDSRKFAEDWMLPISGGASMSHIINIVGYGRGINPFTATNVDYFIVRDSLSPDQGIHYKVRADQLAPRVGNLFKVLSATVTP